MVWRIFAPKFVFSVALAGAAVAGWLMSIARVLGRGSARGDAHSSLEHRKD
jgi:hypothetical protein